ncbi:hypothetical protein EDB85DRAFT_2152392 [Lactarius pseudohatsudake]|nr:hypothetical protein EDB85DRAFT_2152392 [Lactarius pseudohatsudake]
MSTTGRYYTVAAAIYPYCPPYTFVVVVTAVAITIAIAIVVVVVAIAVAVTIIVVVVIAVAVAIVVVVVITVAVTIIVIVIIAVAVAIVVIVIIAVAVAISVAALHCWGSMRGSGFCGDTNNGGLLAGVLPVLSTLVKVHPMSITALVRRPEAVKRMSALGLHVCVVEESFTDAHGLELVERHARAVDDVINAACLDDLALHSAILAGQRKRVPGKLCGNNCWRISGVVAWVNQYSSILGL